MRTRILEWFRRLSARPSADSLTIFNYHAVVAEPLAVSDLGFLSRETFLSHLETIRTLYRIVPLREGIGRITGGGADGPTAALTFDDGFADFFEVVYPILEDLGVPAACFLVTGLVGTNETLWYCRLHRAIAETRRVSLPWRGVLFDLSTAPRRAAASVTLQSTLKRFPQAELTSAVREIALALDVNPDAPVEPGSPYRILSEPEIRRMVESGLVEFGAHTHSHAILSLLSHEEQRDEIARSVAAVRALTDRPADLFAYPNGRREDYDPSSLALLTECGVGAALTTTSGRCRVGTPLLELPRIWMGEETRPWEIMP